MEVGVNVPMVECLADGMERDGVNVPAVDNVWCGQYE